MRLNRRLTLVALTLSLIGPALPASAAEGQGSFVDDDGVPGERHIERLAELGAIHGCDPPENTKSCPDRNLSRAEAFKLVVLAGQSYGVLPRFGSAPIGSPTTTTCGTGRCLDSPTSSSIGGSSTAAIHRRTPGSVPTTT